MVAASLSSSAIEGNLGTLLDHAAGFFADVQGSGFGYHTDVRRNGEYHRTILAYTYDFETKFSGEHPKQYAAFLSMSFNNEGPNRAYITKTPMDTVGSWRDLQGFSLPSVTLPLDDILITCWSRSLTVANKSDPDA